MQISGKPDIIYPRQVSVKQDFIDCYMVVAFDFLGERHKNFLMDLLKYGLAGNFLSKILKFQKKILRLCSHEG